MIEAGLEYSKGLRYDQEKMMDLVHSDISRFFLEPMQAKKLFFELTQKLADEQITVQEFVSKAPSPNI